MRVSEIKKRSKRLREVRQVLRRPDAAYDEIQNLRQQLDQAKKRIDELQDCIAAQSSEIYVLKKLADDIGVSEDEG